MRMSKSERELRDGWKSDASADAFPCWSVLLCERVTHTVGPGGVGIGQRETRARWRFHAAPRNTPCTRRSDLLQLDTHPPRAANASEEQPPGLSAITDCLRIRNSGSEKAERHRTGQAKVLASLLVGQRDGGSTESLGVALNHARGEDDLVALLPHARLERLAGEDVAGEAHLDVLVRAVLAEDVLARDAKRAEAVQDGLVKATHLRKAGVNVQRVVVARQTVQRSLRIRRLLRHHLVRLARRRLVRRRRCTAVLARLLAAKAARASDEDGALALEDEVAAALVEGVHHRRYRRSLALVQHLHQLGLVHQRRARGDGLLDRQVLLAVQQHHGAEVGQPVQRDAAARHELRDHTKRGHRSEVVVLLKHKVEVLLRGTNAEVVQNHVALAVRELRVLDGLFLGLLHNLGVLGVAVVAASSALVVVILVLLLLAEVRDNVAERVARARGPRGVGLVVGDLGPLLDNLFGRRRLAVAERVAAGALPADGSNPATRDLKEARGEVLVGLAGEVADHGGNVVGLEGIDHLLGPDGGSHGGTGVGGDRVGENVVLLALDAERVGEADDAGLGSRVVGLAKVAVDADGRGGVDDTAVLLLLEDGPGGVADAVGAAEVRVEHGVPLLVRHGGERLVAQDTGIVDDDVDRAKGVDGRLDDLLAVLDRADGGSGLAARLLDLVDDSGGVLLEEVVDHHVGAELAEHVGVGTAETGTGAGDEHGLAVETDGAFALVVGLGLLGTLEELHVVGVVVGLEDDAAAALTADLGEEAGTALEDVARNLLVLGGDEVGDNGDDVVGREVLEHLGGHDGGGELTGGDGGEDVGEDVVLGALDGERLAETDHGVLGGGVVGLAEVAVDTGSRRGIDDAAELLLAHVGPCGLGTGVRAGDVDGRDLVPLLVAHRLEAVGMQKTSVVSELFLDLRAGSRPTKGRETQYARLVTQDTGVVDEDVDAAPLVDGLLDDLLAIGVRVVVGDGLAAGLLDLLDDDIGSLLVLVLGGRAEIVDEDLGAARSEEERVSVGKQHERGSIHSPLFFHLTCRAFTYARPRPLPAPVTTTTRFLNEIFPFSVEGKSDILELFAVLCCTDNETGCVGLTREQRESVMHDQEAACRRCV
ncbi:hypothetical protein L1887_58459 [Cichorium endivia]|nr:hypothetical protein L1887_58459 [Cichorium endivia]